MIIERLAWTLAHFLWEGALVAGVTAIVLRKLSRRSAEARYAVLVTALMLMLMAPIATFVFYSAAGSAFQRLVRLAVFKLDPAFSLGVSFQSATPSDWMQWLVAVWIAGVAFSTVRWTFGWQATRQLVRTATEKLPSEVLILFERIKEGLGIMGPVRLLVSKRIDGPAAVGWLRPVVLLPITAISGLNENQLRAVLAHELAHIRRHDFVVNVLQRCVESLLFYHPLVWWLSANIRRERENCCDDLAVQVCGDAAIYAKALIELEDARSKAPALALAMGGNGIKGRILRLFGREVENHDWREGMTTVIILATMLVAGSWQSTTMRAETVPLPHVTHTMQPALQLSAPLAAASAAPAPSRILATALAALISAAPEPAVPLPLQNQKGSIEGMVTAADTGASIAGAQVTVQALAAGASGVRPPSSGAPGSTVGMRSLPQPLPSDPELLRQLQMAADLGAAAAAAAGRKIVETDTQGRFSLTDLDAGRYRVTITASGFVRQEYGQKVSPGSGTPIVLNAGQSMKDVLVRLVPTGNVTGRIRESNGRPAVGVPVQLLHAVFDSAGRKTFLPAGSARTDDRGEYRIYWATPGRYYLYAGTEPSVFVSTLLSSASSLSEFRGAVFPLTFFPGVLDVDGAAILDVPQGADLSGIDFTLARQQGFRIRGRVIDSSTGQPPGSPAITLSYRPLSGGVPSKVSGVINYDSGTGSFELLNVLPGSYNLQVSASVQVSKTGLTGTSILGLAYGNPSSPSAQLALNVGNSDIDGLVLSVSPGSSLNGRITIEGTTGQPLPPALGSVGVVLAPFRDGLALNVAASPRALIGSDGKFRRESLGTGEYRLTLEPMPPGYYIKDAQFNQLDVLNKPLRFSELDSGTLDIVLSPKSGQVEGTVSDTRRQPAAAIQVVLVPDQHRDRTELFRTTVTDTEGRFALRGLAPGDYKLYAWETIEANGWFDPELLKKYEPQGKALHVAESSNQTIDLRVIAGQ